MTKSEKVPSSNFGAHRERTAAVAQAQPQRVQIRSGTRDFQIARFDPAAAGLAPQPRSDFFDVLNRCRALRVWDLN